MAVSLSLALGVPARSLITEAAGRAARRYARQREWTPSTQRRFELAARTVAGVVTNAALVALDAVSAGESLLWLTSQL